MSNIVNGFEFDALPIKTTYVGKVDDKEWSHYLWNVIITHKNGFWTIPYKCGLAHVEKVKGFLPPYRKNTIAYEQWQKANYQPKKPSNSDIMYSLLSDMSANDMSFSNWCAEYGYSDDSISALKTYTKCCEIAVNMRKTFTAEKIDAMRTALEDY